MCQWHVLITLFKTFVTDPWSVPVRTVSDRTTRSQTRATLGDRPHVSRGGSCPPVRGRCVSAVRFHSLLSIHPRNCCGPQSIPSCPWRTHLISGPAVRRRDPTCGSLDTVRRLPPTGSQPRAQAPHVRRQSCAIRRLRHLPLDDFLAHLRVAHLPGVSAQAVPSPTSHGCMSSLHCRDPKW